MIFNMDLPVPLDENDNPALTRERADPCPMTSFSETKRLHAGHDKWDYQKWLSLADENNG